MKKRVLSLLVAFTLLVGCVLPTGVWAGSTISSVSATITEPVLGATPSKEVTRENGAAYSCTLSWSPSHTTFQLGKYTATLTFGLSGGDKFSDTAGMTGWTKESLSSNQKTLILTKEYVVKAVIDSVNVTITTPTLGEVPSTEVTIAEDAGYSGTLSWSPSHTAYAVGDYTATLTLTADSSHEFADNASMSGWTPNLNSAKTVLTLTKTYSVSKNPQTLSFASAEVNKTYGDNSFQQAVSGASTTVTYSSGNTNVATVDSSTGNVTIVGAGTAVITASAAEDDTYASASATYTLEVARRGLTISGATVDKKVYDGTKTATVTAVTFDNLKAGDSLTLGSDFTVEGEFDNTDASGTNAATKVTVTVTLAQGVTNYVLNTNTYNVNKTIEKATPEFTKPNGLVAKVGQTLADVTSQLTEGFSWEAAGTTSVGAAGDHPFYVTYTPKDTDNYKAVTGIEVTITVSEKTAQVLSFASEEVNRKYGDAAFTQTVSGNHTTVTYTSNLDTVATVNATTGEVTIVGAGEVTITATAAEDDDYAPATKTYVLKVAKRTVVMTSGSDFAAYSAAALKNSTVTVTGDGFVSGEGASYNVTGSQTNAGSSDNTFTYQLNEGTKADNYTVTTENGTLTVTPAPITISGITVNKVYNGSVEASDGDITAISFSGMQGGETLALTTDYTVSGTFDKTDATGTNAATQITVTVTLTTSDAAKNYALSSGEATLAATINKAPQPAAPTAVVTHITATSVTIKAVTGGIGKAMYGCCEIDSNQISWQDGNEFEDLTVAHPYYFYAKFVGNENYLESVSAAVSETTTQDYQWNYEADGATILANTGNNHNGNKGSITLVKPTLEIYDGTKAEVTISGSIDKVTAPTIFYYKNGSSIGITPPTEAGDYTAKISLQGKDDKIATAVLDFTIKKATPTVTTNPTAGAILYGATLSSSSLTGGKASVDGTFHWQTTTTKPAASDSNTTEYTVVFTPEDTTNYEEVTFAITLTVNKRSVVMTSATDSKPYDTTALTNDTVTVTGDGFADGEGATYEVTGTQTAVGNSSNAFTYTLKEGTDANNYTVTQTPGTLTVTLISDTTIELTPSAFTKLYDGTTDITGAAYTFTVGVLRNTDNLEATLETTRVDAGSGTITVKSYKIMRGAVDVTAGYTVTKGTGVLTVNKRSVVMTSATDSKPYDTTALTNDTVTVTGDGFVSGEGATYDVTGSRTYSGTSDNTFTYTLNDGTKADNYSITTVNGKLTIAPLGTQIIITANTASKVFDGTPLTDSGYTLNTGASSVLQAGDVLTVTVEGTITNVGSVANVVTDYQIMRGTVNVTENYSVMTVNGTLTVAEGTASGTAPVARDLRYTGEPQQLVTAGTPVGGTMMYRLGEIGEYSAAIPSATKVGTYTVYYYVDGDQNHLDSAPASVACEIKVAIKGSDEEKVSDENAKQDADKIIEEVVSKLDTTFNGSADGEATSESIKEVLGSQGYVDVQLSGVSYNEEANDVSEVSEITTFTFDVTPYNGNGEAQHELENGITFRLPLLETEYDYADVYHEGDFLFQEELTGKNYVEVTSSSFSEYSYTLTNVRYESNPGLFRVTVSKTVENGTITCYPEYNPEGTLIILSVDPGENYVLDTLTATTESGKKINITCYKGTTWSFRMPDEDVLVDADFICSPFDDVKTDDTYFRPVYWAEKNGVTDGVTDSLFGPDGITTRAQMVTFLWRMAGSPEPAVAECPFKDVVKGSYYEKAVLWAVENGITNGTGSDTFSPDATLTRAQAVTFLFRYDGCKNAPAENLFDDVRKGAYYYQAILWAIDYRLIDGVADGIFAPNASCTRAQTAMLLYRMFG